MSRKVSLKRSLSEPVLSANSGASNHSLESKRSSIHGITKIELISSSTCKIKKKVKKKVKSLPSLRKEQKSKSIKNGGPLKSYSSTAKDLKPFHKMKKEKMNSDLNVTESSKHVSNQSQSNDAVVIDMNEKISSLQEDLFQVFNNLSAALDSTPDKSLLDTQSTSLVLNKSLDAEDASSVLGKSLIDTENTSLMGIRDEHVLADTQDEVKEALYEPTKSIDSCVISGSMDNVFDSESLTEATDHHIDLVRYGKAHRRKYIASKVNECRIKPHSIDSDFDFIIRGHNILWTFSNLIEVVEKLCQDDEDDEVGISLMPFILSKNVSIFQCTSNQLLYHEIYLHFLLFI